MTNSHGGARKGAGRLAGGQNSATREANEAARALPQTNDPVAWLTNLMADPQQAIRMRIEAAKALLPYVHAKKAGGGKDQRQDASKKASAGRFGASKPPTLVISNL